VDVRGVHGSRVAQVPAGSPRTSGSGSDDGGSLRPSGRAWLVTREANTWRPWARTPGAPASAPEAPMADTDSAPAPSASAGGGTRWPAQAGRYRLMAARACPWASRTIIVRRLMGLEDAISMGLAGPTHDVNSWVFDLDPDEKDPVTGLHRLQTAYFNRIPDYPRGITVPALVDLPTTSVVTNAYQKLNFDLLTEWTDFHRDGAPDLYPEAHRDEIDELDSWIYPTVNN